MGYLTKEEYEYKAAWAKKRMEENARIETLTKVQHELLRELCQFRHELHCDWQSAFNEESSSYSYYAREIAEWEIRVGLCEKIEKEFGKKPFIRRNYYTSKEVEDDFDFDFQPNINKKELLELNNLGFLDKHENLLFVGSSGVGKTHLATAIGISCARQRNITYFITFENLMNQLKNALHENRLEARMKFFAKYKVLIIDEIGYMPIDQDSANLFFQLIARRYEKNSTIITTNTPFSKWGEIFGSATLANAVLDRLLHHSVVISIKGPSYRLKDKRAFLDSPAAED